MKSVEQAWNKFVEQVLELEEAWLELQDEMLELSNMEELSVKGQQMLAASTIKAKFSVAFPRMIDFARRNGGFKAFYIDEYEEEQTDEQD